MRCYLGLYKDCKVFINTIKNYEETLKDEDLEEKINELKSKFLDHEGWLKFYCTYCIKAHAELRRKRFSGRFGVGITI